MKLINLSTDKFDVGPCVIGIGTFDGLHKGHQKIIDEMIKAGKALNLPTVIFTFDHSPKRFLAPRSFKGYITAPEDKFEMLTQSGVDYVVYRVFDQDFARLSYQDFVKDILVEQLNVHTAYIGFNFAFGTQRQGNSQSLKQELHKYNKDCVIVDQVKINNLLVSSSAIRDAIAKGDLKFVEDNLGRQVSFAGKVIRGEQRGEVIGFRTANILLDNTEKVILPNAVYACFVEFEGQTHCAVVNLGVRPTFPLNPVRLLEVHLIDFKGNLYDKHLEVKFIRKIRNERKFPHMVALAQQIQTDIKHAIQIHRDIDQNCLPNLP